MISYATLGTTDPGRAALFYDAVLAPLGQQRSYADENMVGYKSAAQPEANSTLWICKPFDGRPASVGNGCMLALAAENREQVQAVHAAALAAGGANEGAPGLREVYGPDIYLAYFRDLDGNKLAVICRAKG